MLSSMMKIGIMLKAYDAMSGVVSAASSKSLQSLQSVQKQVQSLSAASTSFGRASLANGLIAGAAVAAPLKAFADMEDASIRLKTAMMDASGVVLPEFAAINKLALDFGNKLPGSNAQFQEMMTTLLQQGVSAKAILGGVGQAAAYLGVALKMPFDEAARSAARLGEAAGVAQGDMTRFVDQIARTNNIGVAVSEMEYAFGRSAGKLKEMGLQGLQASQDLSALYAGLIKTIGSGETVGTGFASILSGIQSFAYGLTKPSRNAKDELAGLGIHLDFLDKQGKFIGVMNMIQQFEKLKALAPDKRAGVLRDMFGTGQDAQMVASIINKGMAGYLEDQQRLKNQADLLAKVGEQLYSLHNLWESLTSTIVSATAVMAAPLAEALKPYMDTLNTLIGGPLVEWVKQHQRLAGIIGASTLAFSGAAIALGALGIVAGAVGNGVAAIIGVFRGGAAVWRVAAAGAGMLRGQLAGLAIAQRAQAAAAWVQAGAQRALNAIAYRGGVWGALQYALLTTKYRMLEGIGAMRAWTGAMAGSFVGAIRGAVAAMWTWVAASWAWVRVNLLTLSGLRGLGVALGGALLSGLKGAGVAMTGLVAASWTWVRVNLLTLAGLRGLAMTAAGTLVSGLRAALVAVRALSLALLANPVGLVVGAIAAAAFVVWKYWQPIAGFFRGLWAGIKAGLAPLAPAFQAFATSASRVFAPVIGAIKAVCGWFKGLFTQVQDVGGAGEKLGVRFGTGIAKAILWVLKLGKAALDLPGKFYDAGVQMMQGLWRGIQERFPNIAKGIRSLGSTIGGTFKSVLGIHSPSKVFMGYGANIAEGAALGIIGAQARAINAANDMANGVAGTGRMAKVIPFPAPKVLAPDMPPMPALRTPKVLAPALAPVVQFPRTAAPISMPQVAGPVAMPKQAGSGGGTGGGTMTVHFNVTQHFQVAPGAGNIQDQVSKATQESFHEFEKLMQRYEHERKRRAF